MNTRSTTKYTDALEPATISVIMSVYNDAENLKHAVDSILNQTYPVSEFIIINDGSTDETASILGNYSNPCLNIIEQKNIGLTHSLNRGIKLATGKYIARIDSDDLAWPRRLEIQVAFMEQNPEVVLLGTGYRQIDLRRNRTIDIHPPEEDKQIRQALIYGNPICHSSVMIRHEALTESGLYNEAFRFTQDYELWSRLAQVGNLANLPDILVTRRYRPQGLSNNYSTEFIRLFLLARANKMAIERAGRSRLHYPIILKTVCLQFLVDIYDFMLYSCKRLKIAVQRQLE